MSCDFAKGLLKALGHFACDVKCCHFHMCQSVWRFVTQRGLASRYHTDPSFRARVRHLMMLPMLPQDHIAAAVSFELGKVEVAHVRARMLRNLAEVDADLTERLRPTAHE